MYDEKCGELADHLVEPREPNRIDGEAENLTLWDISGALPSLMFDLEAATENIDLPAVAIAQANLDAYLAQAVRAVDPIAAYIRNCEYKADAADKELDRVRRVRDGWRRRAETVKNGALAILQSMGQKRVESAINRLRRHGNGPSVEVTDAAAIPPEYIRLTLQMTQEQYAWICDEIAWVPEKLGAQVKEREVMLSAIAAALKAKIEVPGAKLNTDSEHLRVE